MAKTTRLPETAHGNGPLATRFFPARRGLSRRGRLPLRIALLAAAGLLPLAAASANEIINYTYDALGRLKQVSHSGSVNSGVIAGYSFDDAGNRTNVTVTTPAAAPTFSISGGSATEGSPVTFTVTRSTSTGSNSVSYATADGSAKAGTDYYTTSNTLNFAAGQTSQSFTVSTIDDTVVQGARSFSATLSNATGGASIGTGQASGTINDNDTAPPPPSFSISGGSAVEGSPITFTVTRNGTTTGSYSVSYTTADNTATGPDYTAKSGTLTFAAGQTSQSFTVSTTDDTQPESTEYFYVNLSNPTNNATIATGQATGTITDNDPTSFTINLSSGGSTNLRSVANANGYGGATGVTYNFVVPSGQTITGSSAGGTGIDTGSWPSGVTLTLNVQSGGVVRGGGGTGGGGGSGTTTAGFAGGAGGSAITCSAPMTITVGGTVQGGGGGGGGGGGATASSPGGTLTIGGGGGGGGAPNGNGGAGGAGTTPGAAGSAGSTSGGGAGGAGSTPPGGAGGTYASAGSAGTNAQSAGGAAGAAGYAVRTNGVCTVSGSVTGTVG